ncbi:MAG TPA: M23 family metallopeptidase [Kofleriaceae bacterium]|jgi:murein DD-endopeptidase MepM/ murein hydrolase activator NlpD
MKPRFVAALAFAYLALPTIVHADPTMTVQPMTAKPGDAVLVTVKGTTDAPKGDANGAPLEFFAARGGYQAVFAVPLDTKADTVSVVVQKVTSGVKVKVTPTDFKHTDVWVEDEMANPSADLKPVIDEDNKQMLAALTKDKGEPQFTRAFKRPPGAITSGFGVWRKFNDGHESQHLGVDLFAKMGTKVRAVNAGTVTLVRDTYLAGKVVVVAHGRGIGSVYMHLSAADVAEGDTVEQGAVLGESGESGRTTGPHLHVAMRVPGGFVDPIEFFTLKIAPAAEATARR